MPASVSAPPRFTLVAATNLAGNGVAPTTAPADASGTRRNVWEARDVSEPARLLSSAEATYPSTATASGIEADVVVELVLDETGRVENARVRNRAGYGFDESALAAVRNYRFSAARRAGRPVRVRLSWTVHFRLR